MARPAAQRQRVEAPIQQAIVEFLRLVLMPGSIIHASLNEEESAIRRIMNAAMGACPGFADLVVVTGGRHLYLEVKSSTGSQSPAQRDFQRDITGQGHPYHIVRSIDDVVEVLRHHEVRLRIPLKSKPRRGA